MGMNGADFVPPYEIFLAAAIISVFAIIPIVFVIKDSSRLRDSLIAKRESEKAEAETVSLQESLSAAEGTSCETIETENESDANETEKPVAENNTDETVIATAETSDGGYGIYGRIIFQHISTT